MTSVVKIDIFSMFQSPHKVSREEWSHLIIILLPPSPTPPPPPLHTDREQY